MAVTYQDALIAEHDIAMETGNGGVLNLNFAVRMAPKPIRPQLQRNHPLSELG